MPAQQNITNSVLAPATSATLGSGLAAGNYPFGLTLFVTSGSSFPSTLANAIAHNAYLGFTITPAAGTALNLSDLDLSAFEIESTDSNSAETLQFDVLSSVGGFTAGASLDTVDFGASNYPYTAGTFGNDLTLGSAFSALTTATTFRIYISGINQPDIYQTVNITDGSIIDLNGESFVPIPVVSIPEPGTYTLIGFGAALLMITVRRRRSLNA